MLSAGALFSGIGGFCRGFDNAGIRTKWAVDYDEWAVLTYQMNFPNTRVVQKDVRSLSVDSDDLEPVDILHAGFPCQSFSQAGERRGFGDPRGRLFYEIIRLIKEFGDAKPSVLVLENAPYLRYGEGGAWFSEVVNAIQKTGYWFRDRNCAELDPYVTTVLPQQRNRLYMVACSRADFKSGRIRFPEPISENSKDLSDYIDFDRTADDVYYMDCENRYYRMIMNEVYDRQCVYQLRKYLVRSKERGVCPTLTANMGLGGHNVPFICDRKGLRKLTEQECLRLQGFPDTFQWPEGLSRAKKYELIGNAVCVPIAALVAGCVKKKIRRDRRGRDGGRMAISG